MGIDYRMPGRSYGDRDGLSKSLRVWADRLGRDKTLPWAGSGLIADLESAADALDGVPPKAKAVLEYDL